MKPPVRLARRRLRRRGPPLRYCGCGHTWGVHDVDRQDCLVDRCRCEHFREAPATLEAVR